MVLLASHRGVSEPRPAGPSEVAYAGAVSGIQTRNFGPSIDPRGPPRLAVAGVELRLVALPLVTPFRAAWGVETERLALLVRVETADGSGWGECVAMREPLYSPEYVVGALDVLRRWIVPRLFLGHPIDSIVGCETGDRIEIDTATGEYKRRITG